MSSTLHAVFIGFVFITAVLAVGEFTTRCYNVSNNQYCWSTDGTQKTWQGAWDACRARNSDLLSITSSEIQSVLRDFRSNVTSIFPYYDVNGIWTNVATGVIDTFHWIERTTGTLNTQGQFSDTRRFAAIVISADDNRTVIYRAYEWTDASHYICQLPIDVDCASGYQRNSVCYRKYNSETVMWFTASNRCLSMGGSLATFNDLWTPSNDSILTSWLNLTVTTKYWVGLVRRWYIITNQGGAMTDVQYTNWESGSPRGPDGFSRCVLLTNTLQWSDAFSCTDSQRFACQKQSSSTKFYSSSTVIGLAVGLGVPLAVSILIIVVQHIRSKNSSETCWSQPVQSNVQDSAGVEAANPSPVYTSLSNHSLDSANTVYTQLQKMDDANNQHVEYETVR